MFHRFLLVSSAKRLTNAAMTAATVSLMAVTSAIATEVALTIPGSPLSRAAIAQTTRSDSIEDAVVYVQTERGRGSGVVIDSNGLIITNAHVVEGAHQVQVRIRGNMVEAEVISRGSSQCLDLALLQVQGYRDLQVLEFADMGSIATRQDVYAIGYPGGVPITSASTVRGIVSNIHRARGYLQLDAAINPGNSGGAIVDEDMRLLGIATWGYRGNVEGINFAVSIDKVQAFVNAYYQGITFPMGQYVIPGTGENALPQALALDGSEATGTLEPTDNRSCRGLTAADLYTFEAEAGQSVMLEMQSAQVATSLMLVDPDGNIIAQYSSEERDRSTWILGKLTQSGTYTVIANTPVSDVSASYQLRASAPLMVEHGALDRSTPPCTEAGNLCRSYFFEGQANQAVSIVYDSEFEPYLAVIDPNGQTIANGAVESYRGGVVINLTADGWYQLVIRNTEVGDRGNFILSVHEAENSDESQVVSQQ